MLNDIERRQIKRLLKDRFTIEGLEQLVVDVGEDYDVVVRQNANKMDAIMDILDHAERDGWESDLLGALIEDFESRLSPPDKEAAITTVRGVQKSLNERWGRGTALQDPWETCFVRGGLPYVNRPKVRDAFFSLAEPAGLRIAVVNGPSGSGKTYCQELPQFVAEIQGHTQFEICYLDISEGSYAESTAAALVQYILWRWGLNDPIPAQLSQSSSYATELSAWLVGKVPSGQTWWIIVDGIGKITPDPGLLELLMKLARHVSYSSHTLRLVLLDWGDQNALQLESLLMMAQVQIAPITPADLTDHFFRPVHAAHAAAVPFDTAAMQEKAQAILNRTVAAQGPGKLHEILRKEIGSLYSC